MIICANRIHKSTKGIVGDHWLTIFLKIVHFSFIMFNILNSLSKHHVKNAFYQRHGQKIQHGILRTVKSSCTFLLFCVLFFNVLTKTFFSPTIHFQNSCFSYLQLLWHIDCSQGSFFCSDSSSYSIVPDLTECTLKLGSCSKFDTSHLQEHKRNFEKQSIL